MPDILKSFAYSSTGCSNGLMTFGSDWRMGPGWAAPGSGVLPTTNFWIRAISITLLGGSSTDWAIVGHSGPNGDWITAPAVNGTTEPIIYPEDAMPYFTLGEYLDVHAPANAGNALVNVWYVEDGVVPAPPSEGTVTLNPADKSAHIVLSNGNLTATGDGTAAHALVRATTSVTSGKWYWEMTASGMGSGVSNNPVDYWGVQDGATSVNPTGGVGQVGTGASWGYSTGAGYKNGSNFAPAGGTESAPSNTTMAVAFDADAGKVWFHNGSGWIDGGDPASGTNPSETLTGGATSLFPALSMLGSSTGSLTFNFGHTAFVHTIPNGFCPYGT